MTDESQILQVHQNWWDANKTGDIPLMKTCFPQGPHDYLMFNLNGHPYYGLPEKASLWEWYAGRIAVGQPDIHILQFHITGDTAWIASEGLFPVRFVKEPGSGASVWPVRSERYSSTSIRTTEVYRRDNGAGAAEWRIWHLHCSVMAPPHEIRPGFHDTAYQRGLGYTPTKVAAAAE